MATVCPCPGGTRRARKVTVMSDQLPPPPSNDIPAPYGSPPPGYVAYGGYGAAQGTFSRIGALTTWLVVLMGLTLAVQLVSLAVQLTLRDAASDFVDDVISAAEFDDKIALYLGVSLLVAVIGIAQLVLLIIWTFRIAKNHRVLGRQPQTFSPGATIAVNILGGCTLYIVNFFMWRELWKASDPETAPNDPSWKQRLVTPLIAVYLGVMLAATAAGIAAAGGRRIAFIDIGGSSEDFAESLDGQLVATAIGGALSVIGLGVLLMIVRQLAARHMRATREAA
jgi:hypothetical protein